MGVLARQSTHKARQARPAHAAEAGVGGGVEILDLVVAGRVAADADLDLLRPPEGVAWHVLCRVELNVPTQIILARISYGKESSVPR